LSHPPPAGLPDPAGRRHPRDAIGLGLACLALLALRAALAWDTVQPNFDTATVGLMALDILEGARPLFFYGQNYMGAIEAYTAAALFRLFGPSPFTLALAPILFSVGWAAATAWVFRQLLGRAAGWAAFLTVAFPGWTALRVGMNSYGGYTACYFLGMLAWGLGVRNWRLSPSVSRTPGLTAYGLCAGLALWTNFQSAVWVAMGGIFLLADLLRRPPTRWPWGGLVASGALLLLAVSPVWWLRGAYQGGHVANLDFRLSRLLENAALLVERLLPWMLYGRAPPATALRYALVFCLLGSLIFAGVTVWRRRGQWPVPRLALWAAPLSSALFLVLYLPHPLASEGASRYLVSFWSVLVAGIFATPWVFASPALRRAAGGLLILWISLTVATWPAQQAVRRVAAASERARQEEVARGAAAVGVDTVLLSHDLLFGHLGQAWSFAATNRIAFVSMGDERRQDRAEAAERTHPRVLGFPAALEKRARQTLRALGAKAHPLRAGDVVFLAPYHLPTPPGGVAHLSAAHLWSPSSGPGAAVPGLFDGAFGSPAEGAVGEGMLLTLDAPANVAALWLFSPHPFLEDMPSGYRVEGSPDGERWEILAEVDDRYANAFALGDAVYVNAFLGRMDIALAPSSAPLRQLRVVITRRNRPGEGPWRLEDLLLLTPGTAAPAAAPAEVAFAVAARLRSAGVSFAAADRRLSAHLRAAGFAGTFPRFNTKVMATQIPRELIPGQAVVVPQALAELTRLRLRAAWGEAALAGEETAAGQTIFFTRPTGTPPPARLCWNDHLPMVFEGREPLWR
jgi:hypothetical protein